MRDTAILVAALLALLPFLAEAFFAGCMSNLAQKLPTAMRLLSPAVLSIPYALVGYAYGSFSWSWFALYALLPVAVSVLIWQAAEADPDRLGNWRDALVLAVLGLAVDLRWLEHAWPARLAAFGKFLLLDAGIYAFLGIRQLDGVGFDLRLRLRDLGFGLREFAFYAPIAIPLGLSLGFLHLHAHWPRLPAVCRRLPIHLLLDRRPGGDIFSRLDAKLAGTAHRTLPGAPVDGGIIRLVALEQARRPLQLALCAHGCAGGNLLRQGMASGAPGRGFGHHPCIRGHHMVAVVEMMMEAGTIG